MNPLILVVDDCEVTLGLIESNLDDKFEIVTLESGQTCLDKVLEIKPDLIILDIIMPGMDGYSVCQILKSSDETAFIPIILLSALDQVADRIEGYACGAEDYVTKPFDGDELIHKIEVALDNADQQKKWARQYEDKKEEQSVARSAIDQLYEMGALMNFHQKCGLCTDADQLGNEIVEMCHALGLDAVVQLKGRKGARYTGCQNGSLEAKLLSQTFRNGMDLHLRNRSVFNGEHVSILIKNMPQDDEFRYGRFKDNLQILVNSASNRMEIIDLEVIDNASQNENLQHLENIIFHIEKTLNTHNKVVKKRLHELLSETQTFTKGLNIEDSVIEALDANLTRCIDQAQKIDNIGEIMPIFNKIIRESQISARG